MDDCGAGSLPFAEQAAAWACLLLVCACNTLLELEEFGTGSPLLQSPKPADAVVQKAIPEDRGTGVENLEVFPASLEEFDTVVS